MEIEELGDTDHETEDEMAGDGEDETGKVGIGDTEGEVLKLADGAGKRGAFRSSGTKKLG